MAKKNLLVSPRFIAEFPKLNKPDTKFVDEGVYEVAGSFDPKNPEHKAFLKALTEAHKAAQVAAKKEAKGKNVKEGSLPYAENEDGTYRVKAKQKAQIKTKKGEIINLRPTLVDALGQPFPVSKEIWSGTEMRMSIELYPYYTPALGAGVSLRLQGVQVIDLVTRGEMSAASLGFGVVEGGYDASGLGAADAADSDDDSEDFGAYEDGDDTEDTDGVDEDSDSDEDEYAF